MCLTLYKTPKSVFQNRELCQTNVTCPFLEQSREGLVWAVFCLKSFLLRNAILAPTASFPVTAELCFGSYVCN